MTDQVTESHGQDFRKSVICLFDVDGTITDPRQVKSLSETCPFFLLKIYMFFFQQKRIKPNMEEFLEKLKKKVTVGLVGGSDLVKILEQVGGEPALPKYDYLFSENGLVTHKSGKLIFQEVSFILRIQVKF